MSIALIKLAEEDPTFTVSTNHETGQTIIAGMGELHSRSSSTDSCASSKVDANVGRSPGCLPRDRWSRRREG